MESSMDEKSVRALAEQFAKNIKTESDLNDFSALLKKMVVETALNTELSEHLGYEKNDPCGKGSGNSRNGSSTKRLKGDHGELEIAVPRDRNATFEPAIVKKQGLRGQVLIVRFYFC